MKSKENSQQLEGDQKDQQLAAEIDEVRAFLAHYTPENRETFFELFRNIDKYKHLVSPGDNSKQKQLKVHQAEPGRQTHENNIPHAKNFNLQAERDIKACIELLRQLKPIMIAAIREMFENDFVDRQGELYQPA